MPFAFGHLLGTWITGKCYQFFHRKKISRYGWFFLLLGGLIPDADFLLDWTIGTHLHRTFTHSLTFALLFPLLVYLIFLTQKDERGKQFSFVLGLGIFTHLFLDFFSGQGVPLLWPSLTYFSPFGLTFYQSELSLMTSTNLKYKLQLAILDLALGTAWIFYLLLRKRIKF